MFQRTEYIMSINGSWDYILIFISFKIFRISQIFTVNMYNFCKRRGKENLPLTHVDRSHFMKGLTISTVSKACPDMRGRLADQMLNPSNYGLPLCKKIRLLRRIL